MNDYEKKLLYEKEDYLGYLMAKKDTYETQRNELYNGIDESMNKNVIPSMFRGAVCGIVGTGAAAYAEGDISFISGLVGFSAFLAGTFGPLAIKRARIASIDRKLSEVNEAYIKNLHYVKNLRRR